MIPFLPVYEKDPLEWLRPNAKSSVLIFNHWHEITLVFLFYILVHSVSSKISRRIFGKPYSDLELKRRIDFDIHVVSMIQCVISLSTLAPMWNHPYFQQRSVNPANAVLGYTEYGGFVSACAIGYFLWDVYVCVRYFEIFGFGFLMHGMASLYLFYRCLTPFNLPYVPAFLIFELSTPFVNINFFASKLPKGTISGKVIAINGIALLVTFFWIRIAWGLYGLYMIAVDYYATWGMVNRIYPVVAILLNLVMCSLNLFWFSKMIRIAKKMILK